MKNIMEKIVYFDIRNTLVNHSINGVSMTIKRLIEQCWLNDPYSAKLCKALKPEEIVDSRGILAKDKSFWVRAIRTLVLSISGKIISLVDVYMYRDLLTLLRREFNYQCNSFPKLLAFSYLICGFDIQRSNWSEEGVNSYADFISFLRTVSEREDRLKIYSFMCPHREADNVAKNTIVDKVKIESFIRLVNVIKGYTCNYYPKRRQIDWTIYHITGHKSELPALFPNIVKNYLDNHSIDILINKLKLNYHQVKKVAAKLTDERTNIHIKPLHRYINLVEKQCLSKYGRNWLQITDISKIADQIMSLANNLTCHDVERYMPEYEKTDFIDALKKHASNHVIKYYLQSGNFSLHGKALYETMFYYLWGRTCKSTGGIGIGIDRDHDLFQTQAFNLGYNDLLDYTNGASLLYMRRSSRENGLSNLKSISLRQFWRYSDTKR